MIKPKNPISCFWKIRLFSAGFILLFSVTSSTLYGQDAVIFGKVTTESGKVLESVNIAIMGQPGGVSTNEKGLYEFRVPANENITISFSFIGFKPEKVNLILQNDERKELNKILLSITSQLPIVEIPGQQKRDLNITRIDPKVIKQLPNPSGSFEAILKTFPGVSSSNELSSSYSVRGGNFDENLVYVNDIEIQRPFLIRSGQQEGLSFINPDMVSSVLFSAGGFDAIYGDKMSSVLDIQYIKPVKFRTSASLSLLGATLHSEGLSVNKKFTYILGVRQKSNRYVLGSLDTKGDYTPSFTDIQTYVTWDMTDKTEFTFLGNYSRNRYQIIPQNRTTDFGTVNQALRLRVYFDGQEIDRYEAATGAVIMSVKPDSLTKLKFIASSFQTIENEAFDILGQYFLSELERDIGKEDFGEEKFVIGVGSFLDHARTQLDARVSAIEHKGSRKTGFRELRWGTRYQQEVINDRLKEWTLIDSSDYSIPQEPDSIIQLPYLLDTRIHLSSERINGFLQNTWSFSDTSRLSLTAGLRASYWNMNEDLLLSPRASLTYSPRWKRQFAVRAAAGVYYQPPFYRELRDMEGKLHTDVKAPRSTHLVAGSDYYFLAWGREFKFVGELYYKFLDNLIPYKIDNVRIRYLTGQESKGYSTGVDFRVNGEFVPGIESWASLSVLETREDIKGDFFWEYFNANGEKIIPGFSSNNIPVDSIKTEPGYIPRPTDQRLNFAVFFQDYLPKFPTYKMHLNLLFGSGLPFGPPGKDRYKDVLRIPPYRRVDLGFSKQVIGEDVTNPPKSRILNKFETVSLSLEVFNLLQVNNTVSYLWITDVSNRQYAVPNFLTSRQLNARLMFGF